MKKILSFILILVLVFPALAFAEEYEIDEFYGYAHMDVFADGSPVMYMIYFAPDQTCYFTVQSFRHEEPGLGRAYVGTWEYMDDRCIFAKTGDNTDITFKMVKFAGSITLVDRATMDVYEPFSVITR